MARLCKPIGLANLQLHVALVSWLFPERILASMPGTSYCTWPYVPAFFSTFNLFINLPRSSVTTLASIIGVHKGSQQPSFKGAVGHDMTGTTTPEGLSDSRVFCPFLDIFLLLSSETQKRAASGLSATLKERHGTWINGFIIPSSIFAFFSIVYKVSFTLASCSSAASAAASNHQGCVEGPTGWLVMLGLAAAANQR